MPTALDLDPPALSREPLHGEHADLLLPPVTCSRLADGFYRVQGFTIVRVDHGFGIEWQLHQGDLDDYNGLGDTWVQTFPRKQDAVAAAKLVIRSDLANPLLRCAGCRERFTPTRERPVIWHADPDVAARPFCCPACAFGSDDVICDRCCDEVDADQAKALELQSSMGSWVEILCASCFAEELRDLEAAS